MRFHVVYRNAVNGKVEPIAMERIENAPRVKLPNQAKIAVVDKKTGKIVEKVIVTEVDGDVVVTAEQDGVRESVVIDEGQARGVALLGAAAANEIAADITLGALTTEGGSSAALYIAGGIAAVGGGAAFAIASDKQPPAFLYGASDLTIAENSPAGSQIYVAQAADNKGKVTYSLKSGGDAGLVIDPTSGRVTLSGTPDYETKSSYNFTVVATDSSGNTSEQTVTVAVANVDERGPTITSAATGPTIRENSGAGQVVYTAAATDNDFVAPASANSVTYSLKPGSDAGLSINPQTGRVTLSGNPNYEAKSSYSFTIVATDAVGHVTEKAVTFNIGDADEVGPTITSAGTAATIAENSGAGQAVYTAAGTDTNFVAPATANSITWSLKSAGDAAAFSINAETGVVTLVGNPNYETKSSYNFTVVGTDAAGNPTEKAVTLNVGNLDEVGPTITSASTATTIAENSGAGQAVYTAAGTDTDFNAPATANSITWSLKPVDDAAAFSINTETGIVTLLGNPDHETKSSYSFTVIGTDAAGNPTEKGVTLDISDVSEVSGPQTVFVLAEGFGHFVDGGDGIFNVLDPNDLSVSLGDDIRYSTTPGNAGYVDFANSAVTVKVLGLPDMRPLDISGFGADDHVEIFLSTMQDAFGTYDAGSVNFGNLYWSAFLSSSSAYLNPGDPQYHLVGMSDFQGLRAIDASSRRSLGLGLFDQSGMHGLFLGYFSGQVNLTPRYDAFGPILLWNSTVTTNITQSQVEVHWPNIIFPT